MASVYLWMVCMCTWSVHATIHATTPPDNIIDRSLMDMVERKLQVLRDLYNEGILNRADYLTQQEKLLEFENPSELTRKSPRTYSLSDVHLPFYDHLIIIFISTLVLAFLMHSCCSEADKMVRKSAVGNRR